MTYKEQLGCQCPEDKVLLIQYGYKEPEHYDGISEITCTECKKRVGRWSGKELGEGMVENRFGCTDGSLGLVSNMTFNKTKDIGS